MKNSPSLILMFKLSHLQMVFEHGQKKNRTPQGAESNSGYIKQSYRVTVFMIIIIRKKAQPF